MKVISFFAVMSSIFGTTNLQAYDEVNPFSEDAKCNVGNLADPTEIIGAGNSSKNLGTVMVYKRTRLCNSITGCGAWQKPTTYRSAKATATAYGSFQIVFNGEAFEDEFRLGASEPYSDGRVNGCRWGNGFEGQDSYCTLYLREDCLRFVSTTVDGMNEYAAYWQLK